MSLPHQMLFDENQDPEFIVIPYAYFRLGYFHRETDPDAIPEEVDFLIRNHRFSPVKAWRIHRGLSVEQAAEKLDMSLEYYRKIESGKSHYLDDDRKIAKLFRIPPEWIIPEKEHVLW